MGVTHSEHNLQHSSPGSRTHHNGPAHGAIQRDLEEQEEEEEQPACEEDSSDLIRPKQILNPVKTSKSHQELHKQLRLSHKRGVYQPGKPELQRVLEKRNWEKDRKQKREEEEERKNMSPLHQELLKRHQRLEELDREMEREQEHLESSPEFLKVRGSLRRTTRLDVGEQEV